ncbi:abasic site processing protein HMCES-like isoform X1 [Dreissena polymorpha]|uniref:abasic site processing protein HMCES-like isoform X1 n=1 Tax=Dreissena polymorpha TaxID=45954 RepID=UPI0022650ACA|nr:abasic site processing protein HMCES-like isoform X1 [Dreissena polymorpha]
MCGRTACTLEPDDLRCACRFKDSKGREYKPDWKDAPNGKSYFPSYNIAPSLYTPVLLSAQHFDAGECSSPRVIQPMQWGLIPSWHKGTASEKAFETNNCRAESMLEKMTYKVPLQKGRRCVILADGFYEWKRDKDAKQPYFIYFSKLQNEPDINPVQPNVKVEVREESVENIKENSTCGELKRIKEEGQKDMKVQIKRESMDNTSTISNIDDTDVKIGEIKTDFKKEATEGPCNVERRLLTMAGVFDVWRPDPSSEPVYSYSVITVESSAAMSWIHHRMPAILANDDEIEQWLNFGDVPMIKAAKLIRAVSCIDSHPVSSVVNNSRHNSPDCVKKIEIGKTKQTASSSFMSAWLSKGQKVKSEEPPTKRAKVT